MVCTQLGWFLRAVRRILPGKALSVHLGQTVSGRTRVGSRAATALGLGAGRQRILPVIKPSCKGRGLVRGSCSRVFCGPTSSALIVGLRSIAKHRRRSAQHYRKGIPLCKSRFGFFSERSRRVRILVGGIPSSSAQVCAIVPRGFCRRRQSIKAILLVIVIGTMYESSDCFQVRTGITRLQQSGWASAVLARLQTQGVTTGLNGSLVTVSVSL